MRIHFYGRLAEAFGRDVELEVPQSCSIAELRERLASEYPHGAQTLGGRVRACVGDSIVPDGHVVQPGDHVEFFPPVSGG